MPEIKGNMAESRGKDVRAGAVRIFFKHLDPARPEEDGFPSCLSQYSPYFA